MEWWTVWKGLLEFTACFWLIKCIKTMLLGSAAMGFVMLRGRKNAYWSIGGVCLLLPVCFMGNSRLFFFHRFFYVSNWLYGAVKAWQGELYFAVAGGLLLRYLIRNYKFKNSIRRLVACTQKSPAAELLEELRQRITKKDRFPFFYYYLQRVQIYETAEEISPFSGGLWKPYVVVPEYMIQNWDEGQLRLVLCHELLHIKSGHIWILTLLDMIKVYWWINPLVYIYRKQLEENLELACDEGCLYYMDTKKGVYARTLTHTLYLVQDKKGFGLPAFLYRSSFWVLKRRLEALKAAEARKSRYRQTVRKNFRRFLFAAGLAAAFAIFFSYPKYTKLDEIVLYDSQLRMVLWDTENLRQAVTCKDEEILIEKDLFLQLLEEEGIQEGCVYISYGLIMKTPGVGGGGNVAAVPVENLKDTFYLQKNGAEKELQEFFLKYIL